MTTTPNRTPLWLAAAVAATVALPLAPSAQAQSTETVLTARTFIDISKQVLPSVVSIDVTLDLSNRVREEMNVESLEDLDDLIRREGFSGLLEEDEGVLEFFERFSPRDFGFQGSGSGVIVAREGEHAYAITNRHVVAEDPRTRFSITLDSSYAHLPVTVRGDDVELVGVDSLTDLALMRFRVPEGIEIPVAEFADSDSVEVGEWVLALGNPLDLNNSVSQGIISARNRYLTPSRMTSEIENLLQTTAVINPGNSGGPLVNLDGQIVGINNAIKTQTGRWAGIGFAIPGNYARHVAEDLVEHGRVRRGYLGVTMDSVRPDTRARTVVPEVERTRNLLRERDPDARRGVLILDVQPETPASLAGLRPGDLVVAVDGRAVGEPRMLLQSVATRRVGESIALTVMRAEQEELSEVVAEVTLMERPSEEDLREMSNRRAVLRTLDDRLGLSVEHAREGSAEGLRVTSVTPRSAADRAGLRRGDLITKIDDSNIKSFTDMERALRRLRVGESAVLTFRRNGASQTATIDIPSQ